jgi:hypothetical protein
MTIEELQEQLNKAATSIQKLEAKNDELIGKLKTESARAEELESASGTELEKAVKRAEKAERDLKAANEVAEKSNKTLRDYKRDAAISNLITANKVNPDDARAVKAILMMELDQDGDEPSIQGMSLDDYGKSFFAKEGKRYVQAADHSGGGATGSEGAKAPRMTKENFNFSEFAKIQLEDPAEANAIADAVGRPKLKTQL